MRRPLAPIGPLLLAVLVSLVAGVPAAVAAPAGLVPQAVRDKVQQTGTTRVIVEVRTPGRAHAPEGALTASAVAGQRADIAAAQSQVAARLAGTGAVVVHRYQTLPFLALQVDANALRELDAATVEVVRVVEDQLSFPLLWNSGPLVQADQAWARGYDGTGTTVAIVDTGVDPLHPFVKDKVVDEACFSSGDWSLCPNGFTQEVGPGTGLPCVFSLSCVHGTAVAGVAAGNGDLAGRPFSGIGKGATIAAYQVFSSFDCGGGGLCVAALDSDILAALEHIAAVRGQFNFAAVNMSLGAGRFTSPCDTDVMKPAIDNLRSFGIATVIAAGNSGFSDALARPACISSAISVGSTWKFAAEIDPIFTNAAPFMSLFAPGMDIVTSWSPFLSSIPLAGLPRSFSGVPGTSFAAPHVTGAVATLKQAVPTASVADILAALQATGIPVTDTRLNGTTVKPMIQVAAALDQLRAMAAAGPTIASLTPGTITAGGTAFTLTVDGSGFAPGATVLWNGAPRPTTVAGPTRVTASIAAADVATPREVPVHVRNPNGQVSSGKTLPITLAGRPTPCPVEFWYVEYFQNASLTPPATRTTCEISIGSFIELDPLAAVFRDGGPDGLPGDNFSVRWKGRFLFSAGTYTFLVNADDFAVVSLDGVPITDTLMSPGLNFSTQILTAGEHEITVEFFELSGSTGILLQWWAAADSGPVIERLTPASVPLGAPAFTLTIDGGDFTPGTRAYWNGEARPTTHVSAGRLTVDIPAADVAARTPMVVSVRRDDGLVSNPFGFSVSGNTATAPTLTRLTPDHAVGGGPGFTLTVEGTNFVSGATVVFNGADRVTTFVSSTRLTASITAADILVLGQVLVGVRNPNGESSNTLTFRLTLAAPTLATLAPPNAVAGGPTFTLTAQGTNFWPGSTLLWNGAERPTAIQSRGQLAATISAADIASAGSAQVTILGPDLQTSNAMTFTINASGTPGPVLLNVTPHTATAGGPAFTLTADGANFVSGTTVLWNGNPRPTTLVSSTRLSASIPASDIATPGGIAIGVRNPDGQVSSNSLTFIIAPPGGAGPCPTGQFFAEYFSNTTLTRPATRTACETAINYDWGAGGPAGLPVDNFSVRWTGWFQFPGGGQWFTVRANDGVRLYLDGFPWVDDWADRTTTLTRNAEPVFTAGEHQIIVEYYERTGDALIQVSWVDASTPPPTIRTLTPSAATAGGLAFTLTLDGADFVSGATVLWNGAPRTTTFVSSTRLTAAIPAADIAKAGPVPVTVRNPNGRESKSQTFTITGGGPCPTGQFFAEYFSNIALAPPATRTACETAVNYDYGAGGPAGLPVDNFSARWTGRFTFAAGTFTFTARADDGVRVFVDGTVLIDQWHDQSATTYTATRTLTAGDHEVKVEYYERGGDAVIQVSWTGGPTPPPGVTALTPGSATAGGPAFTLTVDGTNFVSGATVLWNSATRPTTFVSTTRLTASITAADISVGGTTASVSVRNPDGQVSNAMSFAILAGSGGCPAEQFLAEYFSNITLTGPPTRTACENGLNHDYGAGGPPGLPVDNFSVRWTGQFQLTRGTYTFTARADDGVRVFLDGTVIIDQWHDQPATTYTVTRDVGITGVHEIKVEYYERGGDAVIQVGWALGNSPTLTSLSPSSATAGGPAFTLTADGSTFVNGAVVLWNGISRPTTFVSSTRVTAAIAATDIAAAGTASINVRNPSGFVTNGLDFTITPPGGGCPTGQFFAEYFGNIALTPPATRTACETTINNDYGAGGPTGLPVDNFSARWTGRFTFAAGTFTFTARADDGVRVFVDGVVVIDQWHDQPATTYTASRALTAGDHEVKVEYYERGGDAVIQVSWAGGGGTGPTLTALTPNSALAGSGAFTLTADGTNVVSGATLLWNGAARTTTFVSATRVTASIPASDVAAPGSVAVTVRNPDGQTSGALTFTITSDVGCGPGQFFAQYFANISLSGTPARTACETAINNDYGAGGPTGLPTDNFSVRWTGRFTFAAGSFTFTARADDGVRLFVDGVAIIDQWHDGSATTYTATRTLTAGDHEVKVEYYERFGAAVIQASWAAAR